MYDWLYTVKGYIAATHGFSIGNQKYSQEEEEVFEVTTWQYFKKILLRN